MAGAETIVVAVVARASSETAVFTPEAFLKGPVTAGQLRLSDPDRTSTCEPAEFDAGQRVILFLNGDRWPIAGSVVYLTEGRAAWLGGAYEASETDFIGDIRKITEQYAVPPASTSESQGIDWWKTVVPVGAAVLGIFAAGLFLMRIWHRIDPS